MKVAIINSVYGDGSTGKIVAEIQKCLIENGDICKCFYGRETIKDKAEGGTFFGSNLSVKTHALLSRLFGKQGLRSNRATRQLIKSLKEFDPDVINLHNLHGYYLNYKILFAMFIFIILLVYGLTGNPIYDYSYLVFFMYALSIPRSIECEVKNEKN